MVQTLLETKPKPSTKINAWCCLSGSLTCLCPSSLLSKCGKKQHVQQAWREKVAICILIGCLSGAILFFIAGLSWITCPNFAMMSAGELSSLNTLQNPYVIIYGNYYKIDSIIASHTRQSLTDAKNFQLYLLGNDVSSMFYKTDFLSTYCPGIQGIPNTFDNLLTREDINTQVAWPHKIPAAANTPFDYIQAIKGMKKGQVARDAAWISNVASNPQNKIIVAWGNVYDISGYYATGLALDSSGFFGMYVKQIFDAYTSPESTFGRDATAVFEQLRKPTFGGINNYLAIRNCMDGLFFAGVMDKRNDLACQISNYTLFAASCIIVLVIGFKFIAALQFGGAPNPEDPDKWIVAMIPCYTEDEKSLKNTIDAITATEYSDKRKLLFIVCDGMVIGAGNDRPTPIIVLDILGVPEDQRRVDPCLCQSLGDGPKRRNQAQVFSGLYSTGGHTVPFVVVVKVGMPNEPCKAGNRGKRDSQLILLNLLNRIHYQAPMNPLELELTHHINTIIGVHPGMYSYMLMVDADTEIYPSSLTLLIGTMVKDSSIIGICGETILANEQATWVTMMQVYEYFISHYLSKAFESLFGSVTCLPGCFCVYRIRVQSKTSNRYIPLLISDQVLKDYGRNEVDTLHLKNLLELGEDRYLTTLMLRNFPSMKTKFLSWAKSKTQAPSEWSVFLSQRRRWINSTVHNLYELAFRSSLCGTCCFSMRFVVFIDLFATLLQPASFLFIVYLIVITAGGFATSSFPVISIVMLAGIYGLQMIIFLLKQEWMHIGWMFFNILATPLFGFYVPLYSFLHMDDFEWGQTRILSDDQVNNGSLKAQEYNYSKEIPLQYYPEYEYQPSASGYQRSVSEYQQSGHSVNPNDSTVWLRMESLPRGQSPFSDPHFDTYRSTVTSHKSSFDYRVPYQREPVPPLPLPPMYPPPAAQMPKGENTQGLERYGHPNGSSASISSSLKATKAWDKILTAPSVSSDSASGSDILSRTSEPRFVLVPPKHTLLARHDSNAALLSEPDQEFILVDELTNTTQSLINQGYLSHSSPKHLRQHVMKLLKISSNDVVSIGIIQRCIESHLLS